MSEEKIALMDTALYLCIVSAYQVNEMRNLRKITIGITVMTLLILGILLAVGIPPVAAQQGSTGIQTVNTDAAFSCTAAPFIDQSHAHPAFRDTCNREHMDQCEYACMMPGGIIDLYCYEDCIYTIC
jgi:hypothetical protein